MSESMRCPYCRCPVANASVRLWDNRSYCRSCVERVCPALLDMLARGDALVDRVAPGDVRLRNFLILVGTPILAVLGVLSVPPLILYAWAGDMEGLLAVSIVLAGCAGFLGFILMVMALANASQAKARLPRVVAVSGNGLTIATPLKTETAALNECAWYFGKTSRDPLCWFTGLRKGVVLQTPESTIGCGHSPEFLECWQGFLALARVRRNPPLGCLRGLAITFAGGITGLLVGVAVGLLVWIATRHPLAVFAIGFLGTIDGAAAAGAYASATSEGWKAAKERLSPLVGGLVFAAVGLKFGGIFGIPGLVIFALANGTIGVLVGWACQVRIRAAKLEYEAEHHFLDPSN